MQLGFRDEDENHRTILLVFLCMIKLSYLNEYNPLVQSISNIARIGIMDTFNSMNSPS